MSKPTEEADESSKEMQEVSKGENQDESKEMQEVSKGKNPDANEETSNDNKIDEEAPAPDTGSPQNKNNDEEAAKESTSCKDTTESKPSNEGDAKENQNSPTEIMPQRPVKKARTAYFIFCDEKRPEVKKENAGQSVTVVARALGQLWSNLPTEEKEMYQQAAAEERERVSKDLAAWEAAGGKAELPPTSSDTGSSMVLPVARVRKICKLDPEVRGLSKEALLLVTKAAELMTVKLGGETVRVAQIQNRRKLLPDDVAQVCSSREQFLFLRDDIQDLARQQLEANRIKKSSKHAVTNEDDKSSNQLTSYFSSTKPE